jgi:hypothetical protein
MPSDEESAIGPAGHGYPHGLQIVMFTDLVLLIFTVAIDICVVSVATPSNGTI